MGGGLGRVANHPQYYLKDGSVSFLTGGVLFCVHRTFFERESEVFRELFENAEKDDPQSGTDARPFTLDVSADEFAQFLWVWYDRDYSYERQTKEKWRVILRLATRWKFEKIKELAVRELEALELPPAERISIYDEHGIDGERVISSFVELCKSPTLPTEADARFLKMESLIKLLQAREEAQNKAAELGHESPTSACLEDEALREIVSKLFSKGGEGLDSRPGGPSTGSGGQAQDPKRETAMPENTPTLKMPQIPDRKGRSESGTSSSHLTGSSIQEKKEQEAKGTNLNGKVKDGEVNSDKEKQENLKPKQQKGKEEKDLAEKLKEKQPTRKPWPNNPHGRSGNWFPLLLGILILFERLKMFIR